MRKPLYILLIILCSIFSVILFSQTINKTKNTEKKSNKERKGTVVINNQNISNHSKKNINCKSCHNCEYPTKKDPCLIACPKNDVSVYHSPEEGPEIVVMDEMSKRYGSVVFSHKLHAQMSEMSHGCSGCHHYNTTGPVLKCNKCHEVPRKRVDLSKPDLEAAYHRQCMSCHRQWTRTTNCNGCHLPIGSEGNIKKQKIAASLIGKTHPEIPKPNKVIYETSSNKGKFVTFYHNEHIDVFKIKCTSCHKDENCTKCHDVNTMAFNASHKDNQKKIHKSFDQHHKPCSTCHQIDNCGKCHMSQPMSSFNHAISAGWELKKYHNVLACNKCHIGDNYKKLDRKCDNCHNDMAVGKFKHEKVNLKLSENHIELDCESCHKSDYSVDKQSCISCHDDKSYEGNLPGKRGKIEKK